MKLIFLDIDGVLNRDISHHLFGNNGMSPVLGMEPKKIAMLNRIVKETGADIVLSSTWRYHENYKEIMDSYGFSVVDRTALSDPPRRRDVEIQEWLDTHDITQLDKFCCIDDATDIDDRYHLFRTYFYQLPDREAGLTDTLTDEIIAYLNT